MKNTCMRLILISLALLMIGFAAAQAEEPAVYTSGDYEYVLLEDGTAEITEYTGNASTLEIPAELDGHTVTSIGKRAFFLEVCLLCI